MSSTVATAAPGGRLVNLDLVRWHLGASAVFLAISIIGGLAYSFQFHNLYPFEGVELLSPGRVRMVHTNMAAYGFIANAFIAGMLFAIPRLTRQPVLSDGLGWVIFWAWPKECRVAARQAVRAYGARGGDADDRTAAADIDTADSTGSTELVEENRHGQ